MSLRDEEAKSNSKNAKKSSSIDDSLSRGPSLAKWWTIIAIKSFDILEI